MIARLAAVLVVLACAVDARPQDEKKQPLRLLYLGELDTPRAKDFEAFFAARFTSVRVADRWKWDRAALKEVDVVVLDWPQPDGISRWMLKGDKTAERANPLGARADWSAPTLFVGSAGLNAAWSWDVKGAFG